MDCILFRDGHMKRAYFFILCALLWVYENALAEEAAHYSPLVSEINRISYPKADTLLKQLIVQHRLNQVTSPSHATNASEIAPMKFIKMIDGKVLVDISIVGDVDEVLRSLVSLGLERASKYQNMISGYIALENVEKLMNHPGVRFVNVSLMKMSAGSVTTQGDAVMHTDIARTSLGINGLLVKVGTLSDSYNSLGTAPTDVLTGDIPSGAIILKDLPLNEGTDEGRAMMQIIHDIAPGAILLFRSGSGGQADLAQGIVDLSDANAQVIVDDISYFDAPFFQDGIVAQAATNAVKKGICYFSSAGNLNEHSYQAPFVDSGVSAPVVGGTMHNFGGGDTFQSFTLDNTPGDNVLTLIFQWNQPFQTVCPGSCPGPTTNLDIYLRDQISSTIVAASEIDNVAIGVPFEVIQYANTGGAPQALELFIVRRAGPSPSLIKYILPSGPSPDEFATNSSTSFGHANGDRIISVASTAFYNTPAFGLDPAVPNGSSSLGGTPIYFNSIDNSALALPLIRQTPDITGPDGGNNTFFGDDTVNDVDTWPNFFGTSAAAPHVAGLAALIIQNSASKLSVAEVESILEISALDMDTAGYDFKTGFGLVQAEGSFGAICGDIDGDSFCIDDDECPSDPDKIDEGKCGCGRAEGTCDEEPDKVIIVDEVVDEVIVPIPVGAPPIPPAVLPPFLAPSAEPAENAQTAPGTIEVVASYPGSLSNSDNNSTDEKSVGEDSENEASSCSTITGYDYVLVFVWLILYYLYCRTRKRYKSV